MFRCFFLQKTIFSRLQSASKTYFGQQQPIPVRTSVLNTRRYADFDFSGTSSSSLFPSAPSFSSGPGDSFVDDVKTAESASLSPSQPWGQAGGLSGCHAKVLEPDSVMSPRSVSPAVSLHSSDDSSVMSASQERLVSYTSLDDTDVGQSGVSPPKCLPDPLTPIRAPPNGPPLSQFRVKSGKSTIIKLNAPGSK